LKVLTKGSIVAGKYRILEETGRGGMGIVYKAEDIKLKRPIALKFLPPQLTLDPDARERFVQEARAASALDHPNICNIHEIEETEDGRMYIAMAFYEGESLRGKIKREPLELSEALDIAVQVAQGMAKAHQKGIVHRDIKPANILITNDGAVKIVDFGLAKLAGQLRLTREGTTLGTIAYMSPEQARGGAVDERTDIWSLSVVLYEMLSGHLPFKGDYEQTMIHSILNHEPEPITKVRKDLPSGLGPVIGKALQKSPADRYQSMDELLEDLKAIAEGLKPIRAKADLFRGRILGIKKIYAFPGLAVLVALVALAIIFLFPKRGQGFDSIAVLPLENLSGDPQQDYFSDGIHSELIMELSRIHSIKVINKTSTMVYKDTKKKISEIAGELGVSVLVDGAVRYAGNRVRITVELIDGRNDRNLWAGNFDGENRDTLTLQSEAALAIAKQIQAALTPAETAVLTRKRPINPDAFELYLKGKSIIDNAGTKMVDTSMEFQNSIRYFGQALKIDPAFAPVYSGMALAYDYYGSFIGSSREMYSKAKEAALKALSLDDSLPDAHLVLADLIFLTFPIDFESGIREFQRLLSLFPNHAIAHAWYAIDSISRVGKEEAIRHAERALLLDPLNYTVGEVVELVYYQAREDDKALKLARDLTNANPKKGAAHANLAFYSIFKGLFNEAWAEYHAAMELGASPNPFIPIHIAFYSGEKAKAKDLLDAYLRTTDEKSVYADWVAAVYALLQDNDRAFEWLEKAYDRGSNSLGNINVERMFDSIHADPRYERYLKKLGLDKYPQKK